jgi:hypothetical protein
MRKSLPKYWSYLATGTIAVLAVAAIGSRDTWATYTSQAVSGKNILRGGSIEFSVSPDVSNDKEVTLAADGKRPYGMVVKNDGRNALGYRLRFVTDGDTDFCGALHLAANLKDKEVYSGRLTAFEYASEDPLERHKTDVWQFSIGMPAFISEFDKAATCKLRWRLDAWQDRFLALGMGWYDGGEGDVLTVGIELAQDLKSKTKEFLLPEPLVTGDPVEDGVAIVDESPGLATEPMLPPSVTIGDEGDDVSSVDSRPLE